jgi:hypothetical protein
MGDTRFSATGKDRERGPPAAGPEGKVGLSNRLTKMI